ncbi:membrane-spanning 4-domains subfamily A member 4A-like [Xenentodon cancila]
MTSTSTSVTTVGGVMIVTQVIPKDGSSIPLQSPASSAPDTTPPPGKIPPTPTKMDSEAGIFLRGEPQGLGVVQIFIGLLGVLFSLTAAYSPALMFYAPFGFAVVFVVSGSLAVAAGRRTSVTLVWVSLLFNVFSALVGLAGVAYLCILLASGPPTRDFCNYHPSADVTYMYQWWQKCVSNLWMLNVVLYGLLGLLLVLFVLQVCVAIGVSVFSGKIIRRYLRYSSVVMEDDGRTLLSSTSSEPCGESNSCPGSP